VGVIGIARISGKRRLGNSIPSPSGCPWGTRWGSINLRPKGSNATAGVHDRATEKVYCG